MSSMIKSGDPADVAAIVKIWENYGKSLTEGRFEDWLAQWDKDGIQMPFDQGVHEGLAAIRQANEKDASLKVVMNVTPREITVSGPIAYSWGMYWFTVTPPTGTAARFDGKFLTILKKASSGQWKIYRDCFNLTPAKT